MSFGGDIPPIALQWEDGEYSDPQRRSRLSCGALLVLLALVLFLGWKSWGVLSATQTVYNDIQTIQAYTQNPGVSAETFDEFQQLLETLHADTHRLHDAFNFFLPLTNRLGWVSGIGDDLVSLEHLLDTGVHLTAAVNETALAFGPAIVEANGIGNIASAGTVTTTLQLLAQDESRVHLEAAMQAINQASDSWQAIPHDELMPLLRQQAQLGQLGATLPLLDYMLNTTLAVEIVASTLVPIATDYATQQQLTPQTIAQLPFERARLPLAAQAYNRARSAYTRINPESVPEGVWAQLERSRTALPLLEVGITLSDAAVLTIAAFEPFLTVSAGDSVVTGERLERFQQTRPFLADASSALDNALAVLERVEQTVPAEQLPPQFAQLDELLPLLRAGLELGTVAPALLGVDETQRYLLLLQNPDELRPTGGFISSAGILTLRNGTIISATIQDATLFDDFTRVSYPLAPEPLNRYLLVELQALRDANWSPDFPSGAALAKELYEAAGGQPVDGVIAFTPTAIQRLVGALGGLEVAGETEPLDYETVLDYIRRAWNPRQAREDEQSWAERKTLFLDRLMQATVQRFDAGLEREDMLTVARAIKQSFDERHILLLTEDPESARLLQRRAWDGRVWPGTQDFLMVVDANVGYTKSNARIEQTIDYYVNLNDPTSPSALLTIDYRNTNAPVALADEAPLCQVEVVFLDGDYADMVATCSWNYLRVLTPPASQLRAAHTHPTPGEWMLSGQPDTGAVTVTTGVAGLTQFATHLVVPRAEARRVQFAYGLPASVVAQQGGGLWRYSLVIQKQAGREAVPVRVHLRMPPGAVLDRLGAESPPLVRQDDTLLVFETDLAQDRVLDLAFRIWE